MSFAYLRKNKKISEQSDKPSNLAKQINLNILARNGKTQGKGYDPVYCIMSDFSKEFDAVGMYRNREIHNNEAPVKNRAQEAEKNGTNENERIGLSPEKEHELRKRHDSSAYIHSAAELANGNFCDKFSSYAFSKGKLAASVMSGRGEIMLTSCLKRAAGGSARRSFSGRLSDRKPIDGESASLVFGKDVQVAVGLVIDSTRSAGKLLELMKSLVSGDSRAQTQTARQSLFMQRIYPFLRTDGEDEIISGCQSRLKSLDGDYSPYAVEMRKTLKSAIRKASAVKERKVSEQRELLTKLTDIQNNVKEAEKMFSSDGYAAALTEQLQREFEGTSDDQGSSGGNPPAYPDDTASHTITEKYESTENESELSVTADNKRT